MIEHWRPCCRCHVAREAGGGGMRKFSALHIFFEKKAIALLGWDKNFGLRVGKLAGVWMDSDVGTGDSGVFKDCRNDALSFLSQGVIFIRSGANPDFPCCRLRAFGAVSLCMLGEAQDMGRIQCRFVWPKRQSEEWREKWVECWLIRIKREKSPGLFDGGWLRSIGLCQEIWRWAFAAKMVVAVRRKRGGLLGLVLLYDRLVGNSRCFA